MNFSLIQEFDDLPRGGTKSQKEYLRNGGKINLQTAIALYLNHTALKGYMFLSIFPSIAKLSEPYFVKVSIWKDVQYELGSPTQNKIALADGLSDAAYLFHPRNFRLVRILIQAEKFLSVSESLLYAARDWSYVDREKLLVNLNGTLLELYRLPDLRDEWEKLEVLVLGFKKTLSEDFCAEQIASKVEGLLTSSWKSLSGWIQILTNTYEQYSAKAFDLDRYQKIIDEAVEDFIKRRAFEFDGVDRMQVYRFCEEYMDDAQFTLFLKSLDPSDEKGLELLKIFVINRNHIEDSRLKIFTLYMREQISKEAFDQKFFYFCKEKKVFGDDIARHIYKTVGAGGTSGFEG